MKGSNGGLFFAHRSREHMELRQKQMEESRKTNRSKELSPKKSGNMKADLRKRLKNLGN